MNREIQVTISQKHGSNQPIAALPLASFKRVKIVLGSLLFAVVAIGVIVAALILGSIIAAVICVLLLAVAITLILKGALRRAIQ
jgi:predicted permease